MLKHFKTDNKLYAMCYLFTNEISPLETAFYEINHNNNNVS